MVCGTHLYHRIAKPVFTEAQLAQHLGNSGEGGPQLVKAVTRGDTISSSRGRICA